jgi:anaerobic magnesium-protoporphyrin IX monomethyl ester cyclase
VMNPKRAMELSQKLVQEGLNTRSMIIQARADALARHPKLLDALSASGVRLVFIGVESIHPRELKLVNKGVKTVEYIQQAIDGLHNRGMAVWASIISGIQDKYEDAKEALDSTIDFLLANNIEIMQCTSLTAYPGTGYYDEAIRAGSIRAIDLEHPELVNLCPDRPGFSRVQMKMLVERAFRRFYLTPQYIFKLSKWQHLLHRRWFWLYSVLGKFIKVGVKDFLLGTLLNKKLWQDQDVKALAGKLQNASNVTGFITTPRSIPTAQPARR